MEIRPILSLESVRHFSIANDILLGTAVSVCRCASEGRGEGGRECDGVRGRARGV